MKQIMITLLLAPIVSFSQKKDTVLKYLDKDLNFTTSKNGIFVGVAIKGEKNWLFYSLYQDTTPLLRAYYKDKNLTVKDGPYTLYYPKYKKAKEGTYINNKMFGIWRFYYPNGNMKDSGFMKEDKLIGVWKTWYEDGTLMAEYNYADSISPIQTTLSQYNEHISIRSGPFKSWYQNGKEEAKGIFQNNIKVGTWEWYHENGNLATTEEYKKGQLVDLKCFDTTGKENGEYCSIEKPALLKKWGDYKEYIYQNLTWPEEARRKGIEEDVVVNFKITKEGKLDRLEIKSEYPILKKAVADLFETMKDWDPAISHNRSVEQEYEFIIPFKKN